MKYLLIFSIFLLNIYAIDYNAMLKNKADVSMYEKFDPYNKKKGFNKKKLKTDIDNAKLYYQGNDFLTKDEFNQIAENLKKTIDIADKPQEFIIYLSSETVPNKAMLNVMLGVGILQDNHIDIESKIYFLGMQNDMQNYMFGLQNTINEYPKSTQPLISRNTHLKFDPRFFEKFNITKAPAILLAECPTQIPDAEQCKFKYLSQGDASLRDFFDKIRLKDSSYQKYYEALVSNKF